MTQPTCLPAAIQARVDMATRTLSREAQQDVFELVAHAYRAGRAQGREVDAALMLVDWAAGWPTGAVARRYLKMAAMYVGPELTFDEMTADIRAITGGDAAP